MSRISDDVREHSLRVPGKYSMGGNAVVALNGTSGRTGYAASSLNGYAVYGTRSGFFGGAHGCAMSRRRSGRPRPRLSRPGPAVTDGAVEHVPVLLPESIEALGA